MTAPTPDAELVAALLALRAASGNQSQAARSLGIQRMKLRHRLQEAERRGIALGDGDKVRVRVKAGQAAPPPAQPDPADRREAERLRAILADRERERVAPAWLAA